MGKLTPPRADGKGSMQQTLPSRHALNLLTKGDPVQRSLGNYAKASPADASGVGQIGQPNIATASDTTKIPGDV